MNIWNCIGEFLLFRWLFGQLFGSHKHDESIHDVTDSIGNSANRYSTDDMDTHFDYIERYDNEDYGYSQSYDDFLDEQDDYDMMDDDL